MWRPNRDELKVRELRDYEALYCGLCHALGRRHGFFARLFLNYDFTFLAMLLDGSKPTAERKHCPARLWCRKKGCICAGSVDAAADAGTILSYWKLRDTVADGPFWKGNCRPGSVLSAPTRLPPGGPRPRPEFDRAVRSCLEELQALEQEGSPSLDRTADTFARILAAAAFPAESSRPDPAPWSSSSTMWGGGFTWWTPGTIWRRTDAPGPTTPLPPVFRSRWRRTGIICAPPFSTL